MREICFDTETTGLKTQEGDRITEIGCVELVDGKLTGNYFHQIINPERLNSEESIEITGLTNEILRDKPKFSEIAEAFLEFIGNSKLVAHNATFDINFVNFELEHIGKEKLENEIVDSLVLAKVKFPGQKNNLDVLCKRFNIDNSRRTKHGALLDAELLAEVYIKLIADEQSGLFDEEKKESKAMNINELLQIIKNNKVLPSRNFQISDESLSLHKEFIEKNIKGSIWN